MNATQPRDNDSIVSNGRRPMRDWVPGRMPMRDAWIPIGHSIHITDQITWRPLHSLRYFLWREQGVLKAAEFHPSELAQKSAQVSAFTKNGFYPIIERYGMIWVWYGNPANARESLLPNLPHMPLDGNLPGYMRGQTRLHSCAELAMENLMDLTHSDFLHADLLGDSISDEDVVTVDSTSETITMVRTCRNKVAAPIMQKAAGIKAKTQNVRFTIHIYIRSHVAAIYSKFEPGLEVKLLHCSTPETRNSNTVNFIQNTTDARPPYRYIFPLASYKIGPQDDFALRPQGPRYFQEIERRDLHSRFDVASARYRFLVEQILERQSRGDYSYESDEIISGDKSEVLGIGRPV
ncbi:MAG: Oxygenase [Verrucomicrobiaceae bacterium]|nr:Oxygenase [Verrucomicrobiaceae bacterium]